MANVTIGGTATGATALPVASTIDAVNDYIPIYTNSVTATQVINRNTFLGLGSAPVGLTDTQSLTNKTLTSPIISGPTLSGTITGTYTIGGTPTFPASVATLTGSQTLTNKTLTSPTINSPTITNATLSSDAITGYTTSTSGTIYGVLITSAGIPAANLVAASITSTQIATNGVAAANLATSAITLGYTQITSSVTGLSATSVTYLTGLTSTVTIPGGGRKVEITVHIPQLPNTTANTLNYISIWTGASAGTLTTQLQQNLFVVTNAGYGSATIVQAVHTPSAGSLTYNVGYYVGSGAASAIASSTAPAYIVVKAV